MRRFLKTLIGCAVIVGLSMAIFQFMYPVPTSPTRTDSVFLPASDKSELANLLAPQIAQNLGKSGVLWLGDGFDAFAARILMIDMARDSIDLRTYIWQNDITGFLMLDAVRRWSGCPGAVVTG